ncbi:NAD(+)/NADH kinase [Phytohabitans sp. ZYX-F-186]|uniref:NAD kinase n=1 Tax=Phytohabitans maris TaxID=3071409 RepID=A0ABU0ZF94_9ACTN|nr:NAD(+)/NADH kinase [Phytohabitans sp. ZYX-F-186]MDQ7905079.1 NAD(+)/NADH kinase [Phytohabitans sp. ZYX-F-186]
MGKAAYTIGLVVHPTRPVRDSVQVIAGFADRYGGRVLAREADGERVGPGVRTVPADGFADALDALVSLGGDGTMLGAMRLLVGRRTPILGVNHGNLGFLVEVPPAGLAAALDRMVAGDYGLEPHSCLDVAAGERSFTAFNDVVVTAPERLGSAVVDLFVNGAAHGYYRGDAVVACTPIGSTAYNYAAGGPVISPSTPSIALTPVAPMSGISRSVVFGDSDEVELRNPGDGAALRFTVDGTAPEPLDAGAALHLRLRPEAVHIVRFDPDRHQRRNRVKLSLLDLPLRPDQLLELVPPQLRERAEHLRG